MRPRDTSPEAWKVQMDLIRAMPPEVRLRNCLEFSSSVCKSGEAGLRLAYPGASEREIFLRAALYKLGPELFRTVYGDELAPYGSA